MKSSGQAFQRNPRDGSVPGGMRWQSHGVAGSTLHCTCGHTASQSPAPLLPAELKNTVNAHRLPQMSPLLPSTVNQATGTFTAFLPQQLQFHCNCSRDSHGGWDLTRSLMLHPWLTEDYSLLHVTNRAGSALTVTTMRQTHAT